ncbi:MAG: type 4a pilus biogenesis protein PilO [Gammaproteobacteria bacterium]|nr:type 4a pilus biogenesis protein PilO [Gammaproteobacteria bacterium]
MSFADDLKNLDPNNPGRWPFAVQMLAGAVLCGLLLFVGWNFDVKNQRAELAKVESKEADLRKTFEDKQKKVANLDDLREQMKEMEQSFGEMVRQLPNKTEVAALLVDISQTGLAAGLEFQLFEPKSERQAEFYVELPINLKMTGTYHQFGLFVSGIAALPRIVTTHNISISSKKAGGTLEMTAVAKTYRALEEEEG